VSCFSERGVVEFHEYRRTGGKGFVQKRDSQSLEDIVSISFSG